jgi:predicted transcriptional regulator
MATARSKLSKAIRKLEYEKLYCTANLGAAEIARQLNVTPRTVRNYLKERREELQGPELINLHTHDETGLEISVELLPIDQVARRLGLTLRQLKRKIWEERRDRIAKLREEWKQKKGETK